MYQLALRRRLCRPSLAPENLALNYLGNSEVVRFFDEAGANLNLFYQLLWRHVLTIELLKHKYKITNENQQNIFYQTLSRIFNQDKAKEKALEYLKTWSGEFWNETEYRVKDITTKFEDELHAAFEGGALDTKIKAGGAEKLSAEERTEVVSRGNHVVNRIQIRELANTMELLANEIFIDPKVCYYVIIDDLDTRWVEDQLKYKLVRALIEAIKAFRQLKTVKIIVALRQDLLYRTISATRDSGFQSEKYESLYLKLRWNKAQIVQIVNSRLEFLVKQRYTSRAIELSDLFPQRIGKLEFSDYLTSLTFLRPRDAILFTNECIDRASDKGQISTSIINEAEGTYSEKRLISLQEEWSSVYPRASDYVKVFSRRPSVQKLSEFSEDSIRSWLSDTLFSKESPEDIVFRTAKQWQIEGTISFFKFQQVLFEALYILGAVGIRPEPRSQTYWSFFSDTIPSEGSLRPNSVIELHSSLWRAVGSRHSA